MSDDLHRLLYRRLIYAMVIEHGGRLTISPRSLFYADMDSERGFDILREGDGTVVLTRSIEDEIVRRSKGGNT